MMRGFCPRGFCPEGAYVFMELCMEGVLSEGVLSEGVLSGGGFVLPSFGMGLFPKRCLINTSTMLEVSYNFNSQLHMWICINLSLHRTVLLLLILLSYAHVSNFYTALLKQYF